MGDVPNDAMIISRQPRGCGLKGEMFSAMLVIKKKTGSVFEKSRILRDLRNRGVIW